MRHPTASFAQLPIILLAYMLLSSRLIFPQTPEQPLLAPAQEPQATTADNSPLDVMRDRERDEVDAAVQRGIAFLISRQRKDGSITEREYDTTMTSLALMALASTGVTPSTPGPSGEVARNGLSFVLGPERQDESGYFGQADGSRMYGHGITTLMLAELLGMGSNATQDSLIEARCQRAIDLTLSAQQKSKPLQYRGGWRYTPDSNDSDLSVSVWHLMALRSAKNDGLEVPAEAIERAIAYLRRSYSVRLDASGQPTETSGGFCYLPDNRTATFAMTSAGLLAMQVCGEYESPLVEGAADWLLEHPPKWNDRFFFYGTYYYAQGMYQRGGRHAETAGRTVRELLLPRQDSEGAWVAPGGEEQGAGKTYATSLAILSLSVNYHYLPIYQR
jgi:hypothetical protein